MILLIDDDLSLKKKEQELEVKYLNDVISDLQPRLNKFETELHSKNSENEFLQSDLSQKEDYIQSLEKEKKRTNDMCEKLMIQLHEEEDKSSELYKARLELKDSLISKN